MSFYLNIFLSQYRIWFLKFRGIELYGVFILIFSKSKQQDL